MRNYAFQVFPKTAQLTQLRLLDPDGKLVGERALKADEIESFASEVERAYRAATPDNRTLIELGNRLYQWLDGATERWLATIRTGATGLTLHIDVAEKLRHLPWELLCHNGLFLCREVNRPFTPVRCVASTQRVNVTNNRPLRLLFMACSAEDVQPVLAYEQEEALIFAATRKQQIELVVEESGSLGGLQFHAEAFGAGYFDVFHLTGHADVVHDTPCFVMENDFGLEALATAEEIAQAFAGNWPRLVFLSGCKTGQATEQGNLPSLCEALVQAGAPAVLGWALPVGDVAATTVAATLYHELSAGKRVDEAVARARQKLLADENPYWHLLRLYADATPLTPHVTPLNTPQRPRLKIRPALSEFLDAGAKVEVCSRVNFVGRRRPIQRCLKVLKSAEGDPQYAEGVLLHGMGGLGKSSLAAQLCERMHGYERLVLVGALDELGFISTLSDKLNSAEVIDVLNAPRLTLAQRLRRLCQEPLAQRKVLFILDDFEQNLELSGKAYVVKPQALAILTALLAAIRDEASLCRVIVTCRYQFPLHGPARLQPEALESLRDADLNKKVKALAAFQQLERDDQDLRRRAITIGAGNPRLLERLNQVLADEVTDHEAIFNALEATADAFREEILLEQLLAQQSDAARVLLAQLALFNLPVDRATVAAIAPDLPASDADAHLAHGIALGLSEAGQDIATGTARYFVSDLLLPLLRAELSDEERTAAYQRGAQHLYQSWWVEEESPIITEALEVHRLARLSSEREIAAVICHAIATRWVSNARYREAELLCRETLSLGEDYRLLHTLARTEVVLGQTTQALQHYERALALCPADNQQEEGAIRHNLASLVAQQGDVKRALDLWQQSLALLEQIGDVQGKAATLSMMAGVIAQQGDVKRALDLWQQSLALQEQIGDVQGKAATLHQMADVIAQQGDVKRALDLWQQSLALQEQIGDVKGKAATLHNMAGVIAQQGDVKRALDLWQQSLALLEQIGDVQGKAATLHQMAGVIAQQGDVKRALDLWQQSLALDEQIGDVQGKAATLSMMAWLAERQGEPEKARQLYLEAAQSFAVIHAWLDLTTVLGNLGAAEDDDAVGWLAEAYWLAVRVGVPVEDTLNLTGALLTRLGVAHEAAPLLATAALLLTQLRGADHPEQEKLQQRSAGMLMACAAAHNVAEDQFAEWFTGNGFDDPAHVLPQTLAALEQIVGAQAWLFDRTLV